MRGMHLSCFMYTSCEDYLILELYAYPAFMDFSNATRLDHELGVAVELGQLAVSQEGDFVLSDSEAVQESFSRIQGRLSVRHVFTECTETLAEGIYESIARFLVDSMDDEEAVQTARRLTNVCEAGLTAALSNLNLETLEPMSLQDFGPFQPGPITVPLDLSSN